MRFLRMLAVLVKNTEELHVFSTSEEYFSPPPPCFWHRVGTWVPHPLRWVWFSLTLLPRSLFWMVKRNIKKIIAFGPVYALLWLPVSLCGRCRMYCMVRGMLSDEYRYQGRHRLLQKGIVFAERMGFALSSRIVVVSRTLEERVINKYGVKRRKIFYLPNEIPEISESEIDFSFGENTWRRKSPNGGLRLFSAGVITSRKNFEMLIEAISKVVIPCHVCIAGQPGSERDKTYLSHLEKLTKILAIQEKVTWMGWLNRPQLHGMLKTSDLLLCPSHHEGMSNIILEGLALKVPCAAKRTRESLELLGDILLTFETAEELVRFITRYYNDEEFKQRVTESSNQAREKWTFNWEAKLLSALEEGDK